MAQIRVNELIVSIVSKVVCIRYSVSSLNRRGVEILVRVCSLLIISKWGCVIVIRVSIIVVIAMLCWKRRSSSRSSNCVEWSGIVVILQLRCCRIAAVWRLVSSTHSNVGLDHGLHEMLLSLSLGESLYLCGEFLV